MAQRYFLLLLAIDKYQCSEFPQLFGCVKDAKKIEACLSTVIGPATSVHSLYNGDATRSNILSAFRTFLIENPDINPGDTIVIFYAGHGDRSTAPQAWGAPGDLVETICPVDEGIPLADGSVPGIPDVTINALLRILAREKGNNITFICDSCHSGGVARSMEPEHHHHSLRARSGRRSRDSDPIPFDTVDRDILGTANGYGKLFGFHGDEYSHIFIAACAADELAYEDSLGHHGRFTAALVAELNRLGQRAAFTSYSTLLKLLIPKLGARQHPECYGKLVNRFVFTTRTTLFLFRVIAKDDGNFLVPAGAIHGLVTGTEMMTSIGGSPGPILVCDNVGAFSSILRRKDEDSFDLPPGSSLWADVHRWNTGALVVYPSYALGDFSPAPEFELLMTDRESDATIAARWCDFSDGVIFIQWPNDLLISRYANPSTFPRGRLEAEYLPLVLSKIAHFHYHLGRQNDAPPVEDVVLSNEVELRMYHLPKHGRPPNTPDLLAANKAIVSTPDEGSCFGFEICNKGSRHLYAYLFCFDPSDYAIYDLHMSPVARKPPLPPGSSITVGYGHFDLKPLILRAESVPGATDAVFFKLFVSEQYVNMRHIPQPSPFKKATPTPFSTDWTTGVDRGVVFQADGAPDEENFWDISLAAVSLRRQGGSAL